MTLQFLRHEVSSLSYHIFLPWHVATVESNGQAITNWNTRTWAKATLFSSIAIVSDVIYGNRRQNSSIYYSIIMSVLIIFAEQKNKKISYLSEWNIWKSESWKKSPTKVKGPTPQERFIQYENPVVTSYLCSDCGWHVLFYLVGMELHICYFNFFFYCFVLSFFIVLRKHLIK